MELDAFDRQILDLLQENSRLPQRELAKCVHLSAFAVNRRIAALEKAGVIAGYHAVLDAETAAAFSS